MQIINNTLFLAVVSQGIHSAIGMAATTIDTKHFIGFDLGTSGARISIISAEEKKNNEDSNSQYDEVHNDAIQYSRYDDPESWTNAIESLLQKAPSHLLATTKAICVSGTSASCLLVDSTTGKVTRTPKMYDYDITHSRPNNSDIDPMAHIKTQELIEQYVPKEHATRAATSALSKLLHYHYCQSMTNSEVLAHQSEYVASTIFLSNPIKCGAGNVANKREYVSDWHNALKLGYDVRELCYPSWLIDCLASVGIDEKVLPSVVAPGEVIGSISSTISEQFGIHPDAVVVGGTTDSNAAFVAATAADGAPTYGTAVTSLGSTLAIKMLSRSYVENASQGVYSHRFPVFGQPKKDTSTTSTDDNDEDENQEAWLVGGASNVGCAILRKENFSNDELIMLSKDMDVTKDSPLMYYPLTKKGERFPIADGKKEPVLTPKPESRGEYLKGILQGISLVEKKAFEVLGDLGSDPSFPDVVCTCGGGSKNDAWIEMRQRILEDAANAKSTDHNVKVMKASNAEASYGAAVLAASSFDE
jgi:sugar (pentulose or hexulose) kinase